MVTTRMAFWAGVDGAVRDYRCLFRYGVLQSIYQANSVDRGFAFCAQPTFQLFIYLFPVWTEE